MTMRLIAWLSLCIPSFPSLPQVPRVHIVGAGLNFKHLTVEAVQALREADTVLYDDLGADVSALFREGFVKPSCEFIAVGKRGGRGEPGAPIQDSINAALVSHATEVVVDATGAGRRHKNVVRLKGGDPFVFGRSRGECEALSEAGVPFKVLPGISSTLAGPLLAGIPLTDPALGANSFSVHSGVDASGQRLSSKSGSGGGGGERNGRVSSTDWQALSQGADTLVFLMAGKQLGGICRALVAEGGRPASTPACVVRDAGRGEAGAAADADAAVDAFSLLGSDTTTTRTAAKKEKSAQERGGPFPRSQRVWRGTLQTLESVVFGDEAGNGGVGGDGLAKETGADRKSGSVNGHTSSSSRSSSSPPLKPGELLSPAVLIIGPTAGVDLRSRRSDSSGESSSSSSSSATTNTPAETSSSSPSSLSLPAASHPSELRTVSAVTSSGADEGGSSTGGGAGGSDGADGGIGAYEVLLLDLDGVLWCGDEPIQGAAEAVRRFLLDGGGGGGSSSGGGDDAATRRGDHHQQDRVRCDRRVFFVTNNSAKTRIEYAAKLSKALGLSVTHDMVATSAWAAANYLSSSSFSKCEEVDNEVETARTSSSRRVAFVVGSAALVQELEEAGVECVTKASHGFGTSSVTTTTTTTSSSTASSNISSEKEGSGHVPPTTTTTSTTTTAMTPSALAAVELDARVDAVVVGWTNEFDYADLCLAAAYTNAEHFRGDAPQSSSLATTVELIGTNPDVCNVLPTNTDDAARQRRRLLPENGCFLAAVEAATGRGAGSGGSGGGKTTVIAGKPRALLAHALIDTHGLDPSKVLVVGDRLDTDVAFANAAGLASALVLTGVATADDAAKACMPEAPQKTRPRFVFDSLSAVIAAMEAPET